MKGQAKRFLNHKGKAYDVDLKKKKIDESIGFFDLWRYATWGERWATGAGVALSWVCSSGLIAAVVVYGELTSLFVQRHRAAHTTPHAHILRLFGGGHILAEGNRSAHMDALVRDSVAFGVASVAIMAVQLVAAAGAVSLANWAAARMVTRLRLRLLRSVICQEIAFFDTNTTLNFASTLTEDMEKLRAGVGEHAVMTSYLAGTVVCGSALSLAYGWQLTLAGLSVVPVSILVATVVSKYQTKCSAKEVTAYSVAGRVVEEVLSAIRTVRAYGGEEIEVKRYTSALGGAAKAARERGLWAGAGAGLGWLLTYSLNAVVFAYGAALCVRDMPLPPERQEYHPGIMVTEQISKAIPLQRRLRQGDVISPKLFTTTLEDTFKLLEWQGLGININGEYITCGTWLAPYLPNKEWVLFCTFMAAQNITMCHPHLEVFSSARGAAKSLFKLLERKSKINAFEDRGVQPESFKGDIVFDNVHFNYPSRPDVKVLRGLSLRVAAGETVALVGGSGCGKSTVLQLLQRMYAPDAGTITLDGHRLPELHLHHFRSSIGVVGQEPVLFSGTIRENIALGAGDVTEEEIIAAARTAHAHQFIIKLANGYETTLGERGAALSGGQKQRLAIARAVLRRPALLLLDEPTSALDPAAERQIASATKYPFHLEQARRRACEGYTQELIPGHTPEMLRITRPPYLMGDEARVQAALDAASKGRTTLVVSHRLSTIVNASRIVYMEGGAAREAGTHVQLLARRGLYWRLVHSDITTKSIPTALPATGDHEDELTEHEDTAVDHFKRSYSRRSANSHRESISSMVRGSRRLCSASALVPLAAAAAPDLLHALPEETVEEAEAIPEVSSWDLLRLHRPEWPLVAVGGLASFTVGATMPAFAYLFSKLYGMFSGSDGEAILAQSQLYAGLFAAVAAVCGLVTFLQAWLFNRAGARLTDRLRELSFRNYLHQEQGWFDDSANSVGALCARLASDCAAVQGATGTRLGTVLQGVSTMVLGVGLAMIFSWKMTFISLLSLPCVIGGIYLEGYVNKRVEKAERQALERASRVATEAVFNVRTVQSLGVESEILARYETALSEAAEGAAAARRVRGPVYGLCLCAPTLGYAVSLAYGGYLIAREGMNYEYAILVSEALIYGAWMLAEALSFAPSFAAARRSGARILTALAREPSVLTEPTATDDPDWTATGEVSFTELEFEYPTRPGTAVLRGLSLRLEAGRTLALVGPSGCGKSTLMHLLMRSYDPRRGLIELDGRDVRRSLSLPRLRAALGLVAQEPALFSRTIRENIAYGDNARDVPLDEVIQAAKQANVHSFIASLPLGYETVLGGSGGGGAALSGGQKQRVAIARALVRNPRVLLLDEATSALDANSEKTVQAALETAARDRTTIIIAHRLATVRHAHTICVIDKGVVAESGTHEELVGRRGLYWDLLQQQAPADAAPAPLATPAPAHLDTA